MENEVEKIEIIEPEIVEIPDDFGIPDRVLPNAIGIVPDVVFKIQDDENALLEKQKADALVEQENIKAELYETSDDQPVPVEQAESEN
jgi:hypothetical protein